MTFFGFSGGERTAMAAVLLGLGLMAAGCGDGKGPSLPPGTPTPVATATPITGSGGALDWRRLASLTAATDCDDALARLQERAIAEMDLNLEANRRCWLDGTNCWYRGGPWLDEVAVPQPTATPASEASDGPQDFSDTNLQVEGVDEADVVKTDGTHLYTLSEGALVVVKSWPPTELSELGRVALRYPAQAFFLDGDRAIVLGMANSPGGGTEPARPVAVPVADALPPVGPEYRPLIAVSVVDLSDRSAPRVERELFLDGSLVGSRRMGRNLYLALSNPVSFQGLSYWPELPWDRTVDPAEIEAAFDALRARNVARIQARTLEEWLPRLWQAGADGGVDPASGVPVSACTEVHLPSVFSGQSLLSLVTVDLEDGDVSGPTIQGEWGNVYASREAIYVAATNQSFSWWWRGGGEAPEIRTHLHRFAFDEQGRARYAASGEVVGSAINQFAFDEYEGHLRVATTEGAMWRGEGQQESRVTVLRQEGARLEAVGVVTGLGPDERIFGVRFLGDRGYVVTFRQVDPLYVLDLSQPANPRVTGELKIPGFSSYLHPLGDGFLLTAGRDGDDDGNVGGVKIEIFDVRDPAKPQSVTTAVVGQGWDTWSSVLWDHKAFVFFPARNLLAIPVSGWIPDGGRGGGQYTSQLALFRVTTSSIETLPSISHGDLYELMGGSLSCPGYDLYGRIDIYRGVFADDFVYSLSQLGIEVHDTRALGDGPVERLPLLSPGSLVPPSPEFCPR